jgi:hypothetical protein
MRKSNICGVCFTLTILALLTLGSVLMNGCQSPVENTVTIRKVATNTAVKVFVSPAVSTNCIPLHCKAGCKPTTGRDTKLTDSNLLTILALLVALSAYLANIRRGLISKLKSKPAEATELIEAKLALANLKITGATPIEKAEGAVGKAEVELEKYKLSNKFREKPWDWLQLWGISLVDLLLIIVAFTLGFHVLKPTAVDISVPWSVRTSLWLIVGGGVALLLLHIWQAIRSVLILFEKPK